MSASRLLLPVTVVGLSIAVGMITIANKTKPERQQPPPTTTAVDVVRLAKQDYSTIIRTRGTVRPRTESVLIPEVSGRIVKVSPNFREGSFFEQGDWLLQIDSRDYEAAEKSAASSLAQAQLALKEEQARARQAELDWQRLGEGAVPTELVLRKPQLAAAHAAAESAKAQLTQAHLNLERTRITAPYAGRVLKQNVDLSQYVTPGTELARIYAVDYVEVRLPLTNRQLEYVDVPELYRGETTAEEQPGPSVTLRVRYGLKDYTWNGRIVRAEGAIDTQSRQSFVIAQVSDPYGKVATDKPPLKVGQFVEAEIQGKRLHDVYVIPRAVIREGHVVFIVDDNNVLSHRAITVVWSDRSNAIVTGGLEEGELLLVTPLGTGVSGTQVTVNILASKGDES
ncbi:MAG: efflux RND transporter periplasmic adaptor subunit [Gammaproteobacteria bacterium]